MSYKKKSQKQLQIGEQIKREIANIFLKNDIFKNEEIEIVIKEVDISPDLKNTKIFTSINNDHIEKSKLIDELNRSNYYFQQKIAKSLNLRIIQRFFKYINWIIRII